MTETRHIHTKRMRCNFFVLLLLSTFILHLRGKNFTDFSVAFLYYPHITITIIIHNSIFNQKHMLNKRISRATKFIR